MPRMAVLQSAGFSGFPGNGLMRPGHSRPGMVRSETYNRDNILKSGTSLGTMPRSGASGRSGFSGIPGIPLQQSGFAASDQIPAGLLEMCRATIPTIPQVGPLTESFIANIRESGLHDDRMSKQSLFPDGHISRWVFKFDTCNVKHDLISQAILLLVQWVVPSVHLLNLKMKCSFFPENRHKR